MELITNPCFQCLDTIVREGTKATIVCGVSGVPLPTVTYTKVNNTDSSLIQLLPEFGQVRRSKVYFILILFTNTIRTLLSHSQILRKVESKMVLRY